MELVQDSVDIRTAAQLLGLTPEGVRKRIQRGILKAEKVDNRWLVILPTELEAVQDRLEAPSNLAGRQLEQGSNRYGTELEQVVSTFLEKLERAHRENIELAGRCGFLQARVQELEGEIRLLKAPASPPAAEVTSHPAEGTNGQDLAALRPSRPWWKFWEGS